MSKSITAKDFAQKMIEWYEDQSSTDSTAQAADLAADIGLALAPEKPEPGTIGITCDGLAAYVDGGGVWRVILANGDWRNANDADAITPARVVSEAELVELSEDDYRVAWAGYRSDYQPNALKMGAESKAFRAGWDAALAKHGHGRAEVSREQVREQVEVAAKRTVMALSSTTIDNVTDAVMELLEGSK